MPFDNSHIDLSIILLVGGQTARLSSLLPEIHSSLGALSISYEIIVPLHAASEEVSGLVRQNRAALASPPGSGYGAATLAALQLVKGDYLVTIDADQEDTAALLCSLWNCRHLAEVVIASRYVVGGRARMPFIRRFFSRILNTVFSRGLDLPVRDMSSGFRLYHTHVLKNLEAGSRDFNILQEVLIKSLMRGYRICEIPFEYHSSARYLARIARFGLGYLKTYTRLWQLRNSISSADYDSRAYDAMMPPQRYWQRQRYKHITRLLEGRGKCLDVGCGSSRIIGALPAGSVALDILFNKLRFDRRYGRAAVQGSIFNLPVPGRSFPCVLCSQVIEHVSRVGVLAELDRVLEPGGFLILGTPDYARWQWLVIEWLYKVLLPQAYADEHITHYTCNELIHEFIDMRGYKLEAVHYILQGELILGLRKPLRSIE